MNKKIFIYSFTLLICLLSNLVQASNKFVPKVQILKTDNPYIISSKYSTSPLYVQKMIDFEIEKLQLLRNYSSYLPVNYIDNYISNIGSLYSPKISLEEQKVPGVELVPLNLKKAISNYLSTPLKVGIKNATTKAVENFAGKIIVNATLLGLGCFGYWHFWGKQYNQSFFLPVTTAFNLIKKMFYQNKHVQQSSPLRKFDVFIKDTWGKTTSLWKNKPAILNPDSTVINKPDLEDRGVAMAFLILSFMLFK
ncbi:MAG: hypothetical protein ABIF12_00470 [bacterium]